VDAINVRQRKLMLGMDDRGRGCLEWKTEEVDALNGRQRKWMLGMDYRGRGCWEWKN